MKRIIALFLVFSILALSGNLYAKKKGAELVVQKKYGQWVRGELIAVKENSLLLLSISGADVSINIDDVSAIKITRKSKTWLGAGIGILILGVGGALIGEEYETTHYKLYMGRGKIVGGIIGACLGLIIGIIVGASAGKDETIKIEGKSDTEINEALEKLRKKARVPDYQ